MKWLLKMAGNLLGIYFAPDNHVVPVLRLGRYNRVKGPGFFWITPLLERTLPPVKISIQVGEFFFDEVLSKDYIPFKINMTVLFMFNPNLAFKSAAADLVKMTPQVLQAIVKEYTSQGLRRLIAKYEAETLLELGVMSRIERDLTRFLTAEMRPLGLAPLKNGGILIKEMLLPEKFKRGLLNAKRIEAMLQALSRYPVPSLVSQAIQAGLVTSLEDLESEFLFLPSMRDPSLPYSERLHQKPVPNGYNGF